MTRIGFFLFYALALPLTYILPYFGSNSYLQSTVGSALQYAAGVPVTSYGLSLTLVHLGCLAVCIIAAWARGKANAKSWLVGLPIAAALFDMAPMLNMIPLVPTVLHVIALVVGFAEPSVPVDVEKLPTHKFILTLIAGAIGSSVALAGVSFGYSSWKIAQFVRAEEARKEQERIEREKLEAERKQREAERRAKEEAEKAEKAAQKAAAEEKFRGIETEAKRKFDLAEELLARLNTDELNRRIIAYANALNKRDTAAAAAYLGVPVLFVNQMMQDAMSAGGVAAAKVVDLRVSPGSFNFQMVYPTFDKSTAPTDYKIDARNSVVTVTYALKTIGERRSSVSNDTCMRFKYIARVNDKAELEYFVDSYMFSNAFILEDCRGLTGR